VLENFGCWEITSCTGAGSEAAVCDVGGYMYVWHGQSDRLVNRESENEDEDENER
jgi:hypothetical protein